MGVGAPGHWSVAERSRPFLHLCPRGQPLLIAAGELMIEQGSQAHCLERLVHDRQPGRTDPSQLFGGRVTGDQYRGQRFTETGAQHADCVDAAVFAAQAQVRNEKIGNPLAQQTERLARVHGGDAFATPAFEQTLHAQPYRRFVIDHNDESATQQIRYLLFDGGRDRLDLVRVGNRHFDAETRAAARR